MTLIISPYKNISLLKQEGNKFDIIFLYFNMLDKEKRKDLYYEEKMISKENNLYCQKYCGCLFGK